MGYLEMEIVLVAVSIFMLNYAGAAGYHCDFESGMCGLVNADTNAAGCGWTLRKGLGVTLRSGPFVDHTYQTPNGTYLYFQSSSCLTSNVNLVLPTEGFVQQSICVKFWYQMYGNGDEFILYLGKGKDNYAMFARTGSFGRSWRFAQVSVPQSYASLVPFSTSGLNQSHADVALDDIDVSDGACEPAVGLCDFENGDLCGFNVATSTGKFQWKNEDGYTLADALGIFYGFDHTLMTPTGHVAFAISNNTGENVTAMVSPVQKSAVSEQCLNFYYMIGPTLGHPNLSVYVFTEKQRNPIPAWSTVGASPPIWLYATVPISLKEPYQYSFVAYNKEEVSIFLLDDITVVDGSCPKLLACDFNNGSLCGWQNVDLLSWVVEEPYPETWDPAANTMGSSRGTGSFVFLDNNIGSYYARDATMFSQGFPTGANDSWCFAFTYRSWLAPDAQAVLNVDQNWLGSGDTETVFSTTHSTAGKWTHVQIDLKTGKEDFAFLSIFGRVDDPKKPCRFELDSFSMSHHACHALQNGR